jgi:hypothetical protein
MTKEDRNNPHINDAIRWALETSTDPATASADWLAMDIDDDCHSAVSLLTDGSVSLVQLRQAKSAYKTMRILGETSGDRRLGARLYAAAIAAGLVWHGRRISSQSDAALTRAFNSLLDDRAAPEELRSLAGKALCALQESE